MAMFPLEFRGTGGADGDTPATHEVERPLHAWAGWLALVGQGEAFVDRVW